MHKKSTVKYLLAFKNAQSSRKPNATNLPAACGMQMRTLAKWSVRLVGLKMVYPTHPVKAVLMKNLDLKNKKL